MASKAESSIFLSTLKSTKVKGLEASVRGLSNISLHEHTRLPYNHKPERYKKNKIYYCKYCIDLPYSGKSITNLRNYLKSKHQINCLVNGPGIHMTVKTRLKELYERLSATN